MSRRMLQLPLRLGTESRNSEPEIGKVFERDQPRSAGRPQPAAPGNRTEYLVAVLYSNKEQTKKPKLERRCVCVCV